MRSDLRLAPLATRLPLGIIPARGECSVKLFCRGSSTCSGALATLEVGVEYGLTFHALRAPYRVAVDPQFRFDVPTPRVTQQIEYHEVPSDEYFGKRHFGARKFDVIYLDGLHTFEQILRDTLNAVECLADDGVIIIDDVLPTTYSSSLPRVEDVLLVRHHRSSEAADEAWMGDVYRLVFFVAIFMQGWQYATIAENHGQLVMWRGIREAVPYPQATVASIGDMDFATMLRQLPDFKVTPYRDILAAYACDSAERRKASKPGLS